ncbi:MAG: PAS domain S-box protein [Rubrobacteraceae bacterium]|jgi:PAS domain S-box-containing protein|nr:PAS domain S-box protein [Rubrobacteraceae bacterium]MDQ5810031.1 PAS domain S-box protein [Actinomycetota bacterium]
MGAPLRALLVEDSEDDALLLQRELRRGDYEPVCERVDTAEAMEAALEERTWDIVISDHSMPAFSSSAALELLRRKGFVDMPFIIVSGRIGEDVAVAAMKAGAHDYIMKDNLARLNTAIERELRETEVRRQRRQAEEELKVSETRFRQMIEQSPLSIQIFSPDGRTLRVNRAWERLWGVTLEQIPHYNVLQDPQLVEKGIMPYIERGFAGQAAAIPPVKYEPEETIPNVSEVPHRWVRAFIYPVKDAGGNIREVVLVHEDITDRMEAEAERRRAEEKYRQIFENSVEGIFQTTIDGRFVIANPAMARMFGYDSPEELLANVSNIGEQLYVDAGRRAEFDELIRRHGFVSGFETQMYRTDGSVMWASTSARVVRDDEGKVVGYEGTIEDITGRKQAEQALREIREAERRRIARELHDVVLQDLTYALQSMQVARRMPDAAGSEEETNKRIEALKRAVGGLRDAIYDLRLEGTRDQPLVRSLEAIVELNRQLAPERTLELVVDEGFPASFSGVASIEVVRIVQEALTNIRRHSGARRATVTLGAAGDEMWIEVEDDGRGFGAGNSPGMGLTGMRERALAIGGELEVESEENVGTRVRLRVSLPVLRGEDTEYSSA